MTQQQTPLRAVALGDQEWRVVLYCVQNFDFNPADPRARNIVAKIKAQYPWLFDAEEATT